MTNQLKTNKMKTKIVILALLIPFLSNATIWRVDGSGDTSADFVSLQEAVDNATAGDTIYVRPTGGDYGNIVVDKTLTIIGTGYYLSFNDSTQVFNEEAKIATIRFNQGSEGSVLKGFGFTNFLSNLGGASGGNIGNGTIVLNACCILVEGCRRASSTTREILFTWNADNCTVKNCYFPAYGLRFESGSTLSGPIAGAGISGTLISNSVFGGFNISGNPSLTNIISADINWCVFRTVLTGVGVSLNIAPRNSTFRNCIFYSDDNGNYNAGNSTFHNCLSGQNGLTVGSNNQNNVDLNSLFTEANHPELFYELSETSPARNAATDGGDCGIFGGPDPYVLSGMPDIPSIFELNVAIDGNGATQSLDVNLKAKSHD